MSIFQAGVIDPGVSDHSLVYVIRKFKRPKGEPKIIRVRSFKNFVDGDFLIEILEIVIGPIFLILLI